MTKLPPELKVESTPNAKITSDIPDRWRLWIPGGSSGRYRVAQLDDYSTLPRSKFRWRPPLRLELRACASDADLPGTWGFGLWNDPFSAGFGLRGTARRFPALPEAAWFFYASPPNHLAIHDTHPAQGFLTATFASRRMPLLLLAAGVPTLPLLAWPVTARLLRRLVRHFISEDAARLDVNPTQWHDYGLEWDTERVAFAVDGETAFTTNVAPRGPLGLVLWIDNQYAAFPPDGKLRFGTLTNEPAWLELEDISVQTTGVQQSRRDDTEV